MKRRITVEQLQELTAEQQQRLREWWKPEYGDWVHGKNITGLMHDDFECGYGITDKDKKGYLPLLDIGQMIELLISNGAYPNLYIANNPGSNTWDITYIYGGNIPNECEIEKPELYDALFEAVKQIL